MIRRFTECDANSVMQIWLETNIRAHDFISPDYWRANVGWVRDMLPHAEVFVHEDDRTKQTDGFIGLNDNHIEGIFVKGDRQSHGIGKQLLDYVKNVRSALSLNVYQKNRRAIRFYLREGFVFQAESIDDNTGESEFIMVWIGEAA